MYYSKDGLNTYNIIEKKVKIHKNILIYIYYYSIIIHTHLRTQGRTAQLTAQHEGVPRELCVYVYMLCVGKEWGVRVCKSSLGIQYSALGIGYWV
jgi:hypothetical protein